MKNSISYRISLIMKEFNLNKNSFSKAIGISNNVTIGRIINEDRQPSYEVLYKIIQTYGSINSDWLLTGKGEMLKSSEPAQSLADNAEKNKPPPGDCKLCKEKDKHIESLKEHVDTLKFDLHRCRSRLDEYEQKNPPKNDGQKRKAG